MPRYLVDVKAFIQVTMEAPDEDAARAAAIDFVEGSCTPSSFETRAWADLRRDDGSTAWPVDGGEFAVDGECEVEPLS